VTGICESLEPLSKTGQKGGQKGVKKGSKPSKRGQNRQKGVKTVKNGSKPTPPKTDPKTVQNRQNRPPKPRKVTDSGGSDGGSDSQVLGGSKVTVLGVKKGSKSGGFERFLRGFWRFFEEKGSKRGESHKFLGHGGVTSPDMWIFLL